MIRLYYSYSTLDQKHEFQIITDGCYFENWFWFYFGKHYSAKPQTDIWMQRHDGSVIVGTANGNDAEACAKKIARLIGEHRRFKNDKIKQSDRKKLTQLNEN